MKRACLLSFLSIFWMSFSKAQLNFQLTPFTGVDYIRVVVDQQFKTSPGNTFKLRISSAADGKVLWHDVVVPTIAANEGGKHLAFTVNNLKPVLWSPNRPFLYQVTLQQYAGKVLKSELKERAGFRSFERRAGQLYLNGKPIFLRGIAINPPGRGIPAELETSRAFAIDYVKYMKSIHVNIIRIPDEEAWFDVCDELGMMVFGGNYAGKVAAGEKVKQEKKVGDETDGGFPSDYDKGVAWYENEKLGAIAHHPSLMIYAMTNETPFKGSRAEAWERFLSYSFGKLKQWDETRVYIANAGYGYGKTGDILDIHRYWGWYYSSPFTFLHIRDKAKIVPFEKREAMPITFTECVGNYTGPDGRYNMTPQHKNPSSQLAWTGHERQDLQSQLADYHQSFTLRQATESFRQLRSVNGDLSGIFPFTIFFYNWNTIKSFADMKPKPVTNQVKISYQPVLLSWECWTPNVYAGNEINPIAHIINDDDDFRDLKDLKLVYQIRDKAHTIVYTDSLNIGDVAYYATAKKRLSIKLPKDLISGDYELIGKLMSADKELSHNFFKFFIADQNFLNKGLVGSSVFLYDKSGITEKALNKLELPFDRLSSFNTLPKTGLIIIGENAADLELKRNAPALKNFISKGGRVIALKQDSVHMENLNVLAISKLVNRRVDIDNPEYPISANPPRNGYYINSERPNHPIFEGISRQQMRVWSDYTDWDETKPGFPAIQPVTDGFLLENRSDVANTAILANYGSGLQGIALAEQFLDQGSLLICGLDISNRVGIDPIAAKVMRNMVSYAATIKEHDLYQLITGPIVWGEYETEKGIVVDYYSGFLVNSTPRVPPGYLGKGIVVKEEGYQLAGGMRSGFNTRPGIQYVANGRRPFGPFAQSFGGQPIPDKNYPEGTGSFWCRIPEGQNMATSVVWNPADVPLEIKIKVNNMPELKKVIPAGKKIAVEAPLNAAHVNMTYAGDRRLVILETTFSTRK